jgi:hypothetical protein
MTDNTREGVPPMRGRPAMPDPAGDLIRRELRSLAPDAMRDGSLSRLSSATR